MSVSCYKDGYTYGSYNPTTLNNCNQQVYCHLSKKKNANTMPPTLHEVNLFKNSMQKKGICQTLPKELNKCKACPCNKWRDNQTYYLNNYYNKGKKAKDDPCKKEACNYIMARCRNTTGNVNVFKRCIDDRGCKWDSIRKKKGWTDNELIHGAPDPDSNKYIFRGFGAKYETCLFGLDKERFLCKSFLGPSLGPPNKRAAWR